MERQDPNGYSGFRNESVWQLKLPEIRFGVDAIEDLSDQLRYIGVAPGSTGIIVTNDALVDVGHAKRVSNRLEERYEAIVYDGVGREPSVADIQSCVDSLESIRERDGVDFVVGLGGGSALDTAKAARAVLEAGGEVGDYVDEPFGPGNRLIGNPVPMVAVPTTGGSPAQISPVASVKTDDGRKAIVSGKQVRPEATIADPTFSVTLEPEMTATTAMDALAPALESFTAIPLDARPRELDGDARLGPTGRTDLTDTLAERAIRLLVENIRRAVHRQTDLAARRNVMLGTLYASIAGRAAGVNLAHAAGYAVQERYHTHHAISVGVVTPETVFGYNGASDPERYRKLARLLGVKHSVSDGDVAAVAKQAFVSYQRDLGCFPDGLGSFLDIEGKDEELKALATQTLEQQRLLSKNPRPTTREVLVKIFRNSLRNWDTQ